MNKEGPLADRPSILQARRKEDKWGWPYEWQSPAWHGKAWPCHAGQEGEVCP